LPAVFLSAFLLFQVQPLIGKHILPWYGGTAAVWTTCLLFFQALLFAGYSYAHLSVSRLSTRFQLLVHGALFVVAVFVFALPDDSWAPRQVVQPLLDIVWMLLCTIGLPYFVLCATGPLLQAWFVCAHPGRSPYRLFAVSNAGSLLALISYPFLVEPWASIRQQANLWWWLFLLLITLSLTIAWSTWRASNGAEILDHDALDELQNPPSAQETSHRYTMWIGWSACGVILFMAVTNYLTLDIAAVPFLWIVPLSTYLLSFIITFSGDRWYSRRLCIPLVLVAIVAIALLIPIDVVEGAVLDLPTIYDILIATLSLLICCTVCHGELYRLRPEPRYLTRFYLCISLGGLVGGAVVGLAAPFVFLLYQELQLGLILCCCLLLFAMVEERRAKTSVRSFSAVVLIAAMVLTVCVSGLSVVSGARQWTQSSDIRRNFFGFVRVVDSGEDASQTPNRKLWHGSTIHGLQLLEAKLQNVPTMYYGRMNAIGALMQQQKVGGRRIGVVGMGIATLAAYGEPDDHFTYYEINPDVVELAKTRFTFLDQCRSTWNIELGDARLRLEQSADQEFDILVLDAFSSDSIPIHLLTAEAMETYDRHLSPTGVIAVHITNRHLDLAPVVYNLADQRGFHVATIVNAEFAPSIESTWMVMVRSGEVLDALSTSISESLRESGVAYHVVDRSHYRRIKPWTDDFSNLLDVIK
jgi:spermidine synthase